MKKILTMAMVFTVLVNCASAQRDSAFLRLAVVEFSVNLSTEKIRADAIAVRNLMESWMVAEGKYQVIAREEIDKLLANQQIQVSGISSTENVRKLRLENISYIVTGSLDAMGADYAVTVKMLDVSTGRFSHSASEFMSGGSYNLYTGVNRLAAYFMNGMAADGRQVAQAGTGSGSSAAAGRQAAQAGTGSGSSAADGRQVAQAGTGSGSSAAAGRQVAQAQIRSLDEAIQEAVWILTDDLKPEETVASLNFVTDSEGLSQFILEELAVALVNGRRQRSVDRWNLETIRKERGFQMSGEVSDEEMRSIGKMLGAQIVLSGSILDRGLSYQFRLFAIDVESGVHRAASSIQVNIRDQTVRFFLDNYPNPVGRAGLSALSGEYAVGGRGPAGGFIFYDRKVTENGWRYLEAAPHDLGPARWGAATVFIGQTQVELGAGKQNTSIILSTLRRLWENNTAVWENGTAAQLCQAYTYGGYSDWFLPSRDELTAMYTVLKLKGIGSFAEDFYWSSSQNTNFVWVQHFGDSMPMSSAKTNIYRVRPVRSF